MFHMTTTTGEKTFQTSDKSSNGRVQHVRMYGGYFSADHIFQFLMNRIDTRKISNIPTTRSLPVLNLETEEPWVPAASANDPVFPERLYQECLNRVSSVTGCSILHERDIRNLTSLN
ncbi:hypothetical protein TNCV_957291 [Trichonephila clavipes]|nr:hypothetical protein TNCV_957291 [Trichonephila clavipes]